MSDDAVAQALAGRSVNWQAQSYGLIGSSNLIRGADLHTKWTLADFDGNMLVEINLKNGETTFGPHYNPTAAARAFWDAVVGMAPGRSPGWGRGI